MTLVVLSYLGDTDYGEIGVLDFPVDFVVVIIIGLVFYYWSVMSGYRTTEIEQMAALGTQFVGSESPESAPAGQKTDVKPAGA